VGQGPPRPRSGAPLTGRVEAPVILAGHRDRPSARRRKPCSATKLKPSTHLYVSIGFQSRPTKSTRTRRAFRRNAALRASRLGAAAPQPREWSTLRRRSWSRIRCRDTCTSALSARTAAIRFRSLCNARRQDCHSGGVGRGTLMRQSPYFSQHVFIAGARRKMRKEGRAGISLSAAIRVEP
jgi:hypothetical protein